MHPGQVRDRSLIIISDLVEALQIQIETLNWCGGKSNLYSTSLNPFTGEREEEKEGRGRGGKSQRSAVGQGEGRRGGREGQSLMGKSIVWLENLKRNRSVRPKGEPQSKREREARSRSSQGSMQFKARTLAHNCDVYEMSLNSRNSTSENLHSLQL